MARGNSRAQSELPSGYETSAKDVRAESNARNYDKNWADWTGFKPLDKDPGWGNGEVGNGIIKDGMLHLRDEDIDAIIKFNTGPIIDKDGKSYDWIEDLLSGKEQGSFSGFTPIVGESARSPVSNTVFADGKAPFVEFESHAFDIPGTDDMEVSDFDPGEKRTWEDPGSDPSGSFSHGDTHVSWKHLQVDYKNASGGRFNLDGDSAKRLAAAFVERFDEGLSSVASSKAENYDWSEHGDNRDYDDDRYDD
jgi:hypothetical protein